MLESERWSKDKPPLLAMFLPYMADFAQELPELLSNHKTHQLSNKSVRIPKLRSWYALYRNHRKYCQPFLQMLSEASEYSAQLITLGCAIQEHSRRKDPVKYQPTENEIIEAKRFWTSLKAQSFDELRSDFEGRNLTKSVSDAIEQYLKRHYMEYSFIYLVFVPCFVVYKTSPGILYHRAIKGDVASIDKLLRLDPLLLHDPAIGQQIQKIRLSGKHGVYNNLIEAPMKPIKANLTPGKIKTSMAALISNISEALGYPITAPEIRKLFNAIAKDSKQSAHDSHLPNNNDALSKAIQRKRSDWNPLLKPDSKIIL